MIYLILSFVFLALAVILHAIFFSNHSKNIVSFFLLALAGLIGYIAVTTALPMTQEISFWNLPLRWTALSIYVLLMPYYPVFAYAAVLASPSQTALSLIRQHGSISFQELSKHINDEQFVLARLDSLVQQGFIIREHDRYRLPWKTAMFCRVIAVYQWILGRETGG